MAYKLDSIVNIKKYQGKTVEQCINQHMYAFNIMINKNAAWYSEEVHDYLDECNDKLKSNRNRILDKQYQRAVQRINT